jgi:hypothetical protein
MSTPIDCLISLVFLDLSPILMIALALVVIAYRSPITTSSSASSPFTSSTELLSPTSCLAKLTKLSDKDGYECKSIPCKRLYVLIFFGGRISGDACSSLLFNEVPVLPPAGELGCVQLGDLTR